jgi:hypothetical protein
MKISERDIHVLGKIGDKDRFVSPYCANQV